MNGLQLIHKSHSSSRHFSIFSRNSAQLIQLIVFSFHHVGLIQCNDSDNELFKNIDIDKIKEKLPPGIEIPASLQNVTSVMASLDEFKKVIKEKCNKVSGGEAAYEAIENGATELQTCTSGLIDVEQLQKEIEEAEPHGELDTVFNK